MMVEKFEEDKIALAVSKAWSLWVNQNEIRHGGGGKTSWNWCSRL